MRPTPVPHQITGAAFLAMRGFAILADEPGAGKTAQVIMAADMVRAMRILVICPAVVRRHWELEFLTWQQIPRHIRVEEGRIHGMPVHDRVTIVSHASLVDKGSIACLRTGQYDLIVVDEAHEMRQFDAARTRALLYPWRAPTLIPAYDEPPGLWHLAHRFWCVTGTPVVNSACDLWPLAAGPMRRPEEWYAWGLNYAAEMRQDSYGGIRPIGMKNTVALADIFRPHMLRRTLAGIGIQLPALTISQVPVLIGLDELRRVMADLEGWTPAKLAQALEERDELQDSALARVRQALGLAKVPEIVRHVVEIIRSGHGPVVVFFQHTAVREKLHFELSNTHNLICGWIDGKTTKTQLKSGIDWFQGGHLNVLLVQIQSGGMGITLTRGHRVVVAELPWTSVAQIQAIKRVHRIGQKLPVLAEIIRANDCWLEQILASTINRKHVASNQFLQLLETRN